MSLEESNRRRGPGSNEAPDHVDLGFYSEVDAKPLKHVSREVTQSDLLSIRFLTAGLRIDCGDKDWKRRSIKKELG